ncbi:hypothetical protein GIV92_23190, partial [Pseudomonas syringae]|nr:hypothetical protein [Pseudomonas syringae]MCF5388141.1 hypothetical protein [Pseudomonas syringae]MCF5439373.1 hypothetical protein [Pseudomonas syringae]MCF5463222.1 hypothetical protein [Pseudomonas syringae]
MLTKTPVQARLSCDALRRMPFWTLRVLLTTQSVENCVPTLEWCDPRRLDATFGGVMGKYTEQAKLAAVKEYCAGKAGLRDVAR